jgi:hypothetical protein
LYSAFRRKIKKQALPLLGFIDKGDFTVEKDNKSPSKPQDLEKSHGLSNILRLIILVAGLAGAWFLLDWLINGK